jgi:ATP-dependent Lon protease
VAREVDTSDFHVEVLDLLDNQVEAEIGVAFFIAAYSAIHSPLLRPVCSCSAP